MTVEDLRNLFRFFSTTQCRGRSAVYQELATRVADDDQLLQLVMIAPPAQRRPSLLFASVNWLLARDPDAPLRRYYPIHGGDQGVDEELYPMFADFCREHRAALAEVLAHRSTQTNEVRRCVALRWGLSRLAARWPGAVHLVEVGTSAGLNLFFDRYTYRIGGRELDGPDSDVVIATELRGPADRLAWADRPSPMILRRLGLDQAPVDLADEEARRWLEAFVWPEHRSELATLRAAISTFRASDSELALVRGDALTDTAALITELPGDEPVLVFTATLLSYLSAVQSHAFVEQLELAARHRRVAWVFAESAALVAGSGVSTPGLAGPLAKAAAVCAVGVSFRGDGDQEEDVLALADPYLRWVAPARTDDDDFAWAAAEGLY
ncbi:DUF2332 domain-containing protein [Microlunatus speluncae]|uniref:DUF2332 domain-containing protein n=1 Tax=Microlunatus speluncae TaxID=2594267 RepID=UPI00137570D2|nr:DUF2332 domain-containing protein [Microlunatus speluncae]